MNAHHDVAVIIDSLCEIAGARRPSDPLLQPFLGIYYRDIPSDDADGRRLNAAYAAAVAHLQLGRVRRVGETLVEVLSPDLERDGWETERTILMFVTDDVPFLVDSVRMVLDRYELGIHLLIHPMLSVGRNDRHELTHVDDPDGRVEAWTLIELDRCPPGAREQLEADVRTAIDDVQSVVRDFAPMQERLLDVAGDDALMQWLADTNFVFLGSAVYERTTDGLRLDPASLLGQYRSRRLDPERIDPPSKDGDGDIVIARTDAVATVHRPARMTSIAVRLPTNREVRFVGLLGSAAYRQSVFRNPRHRRPRRRGGRSGRCRPREPYRSRRPQRHRDAASRPGVRIRRRRTGRAGLGDHRTAGTPHRQSVRPHRAGRALDHGAGVRASVTIHCRAPGPRRRAGVGVVRR